MAIIRWARRAALTAAALAFALPFTTGTAQADPILVIGQDNNVSANVAVSGNLDSVPVGASFGFNTGSADHGAAAVNGGSAFAMDLACHADQWVGMWTGMDLDTDADVVVEEPAADVDVAVQEPAADVDVAVQEPAADVVVESPEPAVDVDASADASISADASVSADASISANVDLGGTVDGLVQATGALLNGMNVSVGADASTGSGASVSADVNGNLDADVDASVNGVDAYVDASIHGVDANVDAGLGDADASVNLDGPTVSADAATGLNAEANASLSTNVDLASGDVSAEGVIGAHISIG